MSRSLKIYTVVLVLLMCLAVWFELSRPTPVDWTPTFNEKHTKPYGLKVFREQLPAFFGSDSVININSTIYEFLDQHYSYTDSTYTIKGNYLYINHRSTLDETSVQELLYFASHGNDIFISSEDFPKMLMDTLGFKVAYDYSFKGDADLYFANPELKNKGTSIKKGIDNIYFNTLDSAKTVVLGYQNFNKEAINFVKINHVHGHFYLHTQPIAFTNYHLLKENDKKYAEGVLSYLPQKPVYFESVNKLAYSFGDSPFRFILSQPPLKWAWFMALLLLFTFLAFNAKRRQRIVKVIEPLRNTTIDFTKTVANLYFETKDHKNLIYKKITYFLERIRSEYYLDTEVLNEKFITNLALKSGNQKSKVATLINTIVQLQRKNYHTEENLLNLNKLIEEFYHNKN